MRSRPRKKILLAVAAATAMLGAVPGDAAASHKESPIDAVATVAGCRGASLTIAAQFEPAEDAKRRALRAARRANLRVRFEAAPLFGPTRKSREFDLGRTTTARRSVRFGDLPAQSYSGIVRYRWVRGKRTVMSGMMRTRKARVAGRRGKAFCSLRVGKRPVDTRPPIIVPTPYDSGWKRGPLNVRFFVFDDLSGVALVASRVDGGPFVRGRATTISGQGSHRLEYVARDAAGNQTPLLGVTLRIDQGAPTQPTVTAPLSPTTDPTPEIRWNGSTDTGSGVAGYVALVRNSGGAIVWSQVVSASARAATVGQALGLGNYTAEVVAFDGAAPQPFTATGTRAFTLVEPATPPPDSDADGVADPSDNCPNTSNPNQANFDGDGLGDACDGDDDNDGLGDAADPNDADTDSDDDGVTDGAEDDQDTFPDDPDSDDDGFDDSEDQCPAVPESGVDIDPEGCP
jgi:hypothetical protein